MATALPLDAYPAFRAPTLDALALAVESSLGAKFVELPKNRQPIDAHANHFKLPNSGLWFCTYGMPVALKFPEADHVRVQFHHAGTGATWVGDQLIPITARRACISSGPVEIDFAADFQQVVWRIPKYVLVQKLSVLTGGPVLCEPEFENVFDLEAPRATALRGILTCLMRAAETVTGESGGMIMAELEQAMLTAFLAASRHAMSERLERKVTSAAPWQVARAESYIAENWDQPVSIEDLSSVTGASARSIFRAFRQSRGYTPLEFAKRIRLENAQRMLQDSEDRRSVTEVAFSCGFGDLGRFSKEYAQAFGERPSVVLNRKKAAARVQ